jgi:hypothetical protein
MPRMIKDSGMVAKREDRRARRIVGRERDLCFFDYRVNHLLSPNVKDEPRPQLARAVQQHGS